MESKPIVYMERWCPTSDDIVVKVEYYEPPRRPNPTAEELALVPVRFRCQSCLQVKPRKHYGGLVGELRVCRTCYPYVEHISEPVRRQATKWNIPLCHDVWEGIKPAMLATVES